MQYTSKYDFIVLLDDFIIWVTFMFLDKKIFPVNTLISMCKRKVNSLYTLHKEMAFLVTDKKSIIVEGDNPNTIT